MNPSTQVSLDQMVERFEDILAESHDIFHRIPEERMSEKPSPEKWSKKEILGHLIDSAVNNLQRFTEVQYESRPYQVRDYRQDELVAANNYQNAPTSELLETWFSLNVRIMGVMKRQTPETLDYDIILPEGAKRDLRFLMEDYVDHMDHHLRQIFS